MGLLENTGVLKNKEVLVVSGEWGRGFFLVLNGVFCGSPLLKFKTSSCSLRPVLGSYSLWNDRNSVNLLQEVRVRDKLFHDRTRFYVVEWAMNPCREA